MGTSPETVAMSARDQNSAQTEDPIAVLVCSRVEPTLAISPPSVQHAADRVEVTAVVPRITTLAHVGALQAVVCVCGCCPIVGGKAPPMSDFSVVVSPGIAVMAILVLDEGPPKHGVCRCATSVPLVGHVPL